MATSQEGVTICPGLIMQLMAIGGLVNPELNDHFVKDLLNGMLIKGKVQGGYEITERGEAYINILCDTQFPVQAWIPHTAWK